MPVRRTLPASSQLQRGSVRRPVGVLILAVVFAIAVASAASARPLLSWEGATGLYEPRSLCPANHSCFTHARWRSWGQSAVAVAQGRTQYPGGPARTGRTTVVLSRPEPMCCGVRYTRAKWRYQSGGGWTDSIFEPLGTCGFWTGA